ncbi:translation initiation factor IF-3 [Brachyspira hampsonii]|uniref:Translation initiation factor IF-3 n=1 Tax=Brachyspira hampsonii TaxID=1287055 RepID=A0AAC9TV78_9SPIR|nr:translation initiation factor IF-3 [Brachyspira hampsonii]ASJ22518.1 translation initiation factor IF-3 [Brachyspira hampsonii]ELV05204.1 translation initiation factor IF-3 [Brachyspira hampsonii 30599]MBW5380002.1 translation initiation factor IF-3 [Brachyspira hampsonii]MBW5411024.1 translation initiation factor IF-3 [Brachyspira hampsonii]OEJ17851.1 translation initiation factor IF-3 [Brachyspira hampsonii]
MATVKKEGERINQFITAPEVRVVHDERGSLGVMSIKDALALAKSEGSDLVEIAPTAEPPVCKIINYGKYKFDIQKKSKEAKKKQKLVQLKEIKMRPQISIHDYNFKMKHIREFLDEGNKVKITIMFRGREMAHTEFGYELINKIIQDLENEASTEKPAKLEGKNLSAVLNPVKAKKTASDSEGSSAKKESSGNTEE